MPLYTMFQTVLSYIFPWTVSFTHLKLTDIRTIDRQVLKIVSENGGKPPLSSTVLIDLPRADGGRGLKSVETEFKQTKVNAALKLFSNTDPTMELVRRFEEHAAGKGHPSLVKEVGRFSEEMGVSLELVYTNPRYPRSNQNNFT